TVRVPPTYLDFTHTRIFWGLGSARVSRVGFGVSPKQSLRKFAIARTQSAARETGALPKPVKLAMMPAHDLTSAVRKSRCRFWRGEQTQHRLGDCEGMGGSGCSLNF